MTERRWRGRSRETWHQVVRREYEATNRNFELAEKLVQDRRQGKVQVDVT